MSTKLLIFLIFALRLILKIFFNEESVFTNIILTQFLVIAVPTFVWLILKGNGISIYFKNTRKNFFLDIIVAVITIFSANLASQYLNLELFGTFGVYPDRSDNYLLNNDLLFIIVIVCAIPAVFEEILFRGVVLNDAFKKYSKIGAIVLTSLLFSLIHFDITNFIPQFIIGVILCYVTLATKSITTSIISHFANNLLAIWINSTQFHNIDEHRLLMILMCIAIAITGVGYFNFKSPRREI